MTLDQRFSAWLDGELDSDEASQVAALVAADPALATAVEELASVRTMLRSTSVDPPEGAIERIIASVEADDSESGHDVAPVVGLDERRWKRARVLGAVAASFVIIVGVVGGLAGGTTIPAVGDLVRQHEAAAAGAELDPMADEMMAEAPAMGGMAVAHVGMTGADTAHFVYEADDGTLVSVFRQAGEADLHALDDDMGIGEMAEVDGQGMWVADIDTSHVAVVDGDGYVWTIVADVDHEMSMDMMADLPARDRSWWELGRDLAREIVQPFGLGD